MEDSASTKRLQLFPCQIQAASCATAISVAKLVSTYLRLVIAFVEKLVLREFVWNPRGRTKHGVLTKVDLHLLMHHLQDIIFSDKKMCESKEICFQVCLLSLRSAGIEQGACASYHLNQPKLWEVDRGLFHCKCFKIWPPGKIPGTVASCRGVKESQLPSTSVQSATSSGLGNNTPFMQEMNQKSLKWKLLRHEQTNDVARISWSCLVGKSIWVVGTFVA